MFRRLYFPDFSRCFCRTSQRAEKAVEHKGDSDTNNSWRVLGTVSKSLEKRKKRTPPPTNIAYLYSSDHKLRNGTTRNI